MEKPIAHPPEVMDFSRGGDLRQQVGRDSEGDSTADDFVYEDHNQNPFHLLLKVVDVCKSDNFSGVITTNYTSLVKYRW